MLEICVQSGLWYQESDPEGSIRFIRECGFEAIDYNIDTFLPGKAIRHGELTDFFSQSVEELLEYHKSMKEACLRYDVKVAQMHAPFPLYIDEREDINEYLIQVVEKVCAVAQYLGCPAVVVHPYKNYTDKKKEREVNLQMYRKMIPAAKKHGITLCLENLFDSRNGLFTEGACTSAEEAIWYLDTLNKEAGEKIFGFCLDIGHLNLVGNNIRNFIEKMGNHVTILHIHDNTGANADAHMIPFTQGAHGKSFIDWEGMIEGLKLIGYTGPLSFETFYGINVLPEELRPTGLRLVCAIGGYFKKRLTCGKKGKTLLC